MANNAGLQAWKTAINGWEDEKARYAGIKRYPDAYALVFLEQLLTQKYGEALSNVAKTLKAARAHPEALPKAAYYMVKGEQIEPIFASRVLAYVETRISTDLERNRLQKGDKLYKLLTGNTELDKPSYLKMLNEEATIVFSLFKERSGQQMRPSVKETFDLALESTDIASKQFIILIGLYLMAEYRQQFLDTAGTTLVKPKRFHMFLTEILPERLKSLCEGQISGLYEFIQLTRGDYATIDRDHHNC